MPAALAAFLLLVSAPDAASLYLFLDTNGDSAWTAEDVLNPADTTQVTVWLKTYEYKEGTAPKCSHGNREGEHSYSIILQASGGTVWWTAFTPEPIPRGDPVAHETDDSTFMAVSRRIPNWGSARIIRLGTFKVAIRRGRPSIVIVDRVSNLPDQDTRIATGTWSGPASACADGLPYGGPANRAPSLTRLADFPIRAGAREHLTIQAEDLDGDPLEFRVLRGPSFASVRTLAAGSGIATGEIRVAPDSCASGPAQFIVEVSDGFSTDVDTSTIVVQPIKRDIPTSPMTVSTSDPTDLPYQQVSIDSLWLVGEWEWHHTITGKPVLRMLGIEERPAQAGHRRRILFSSTGEVQLFEVDKDRVLTALRGTYRLSREQGGLTLSLSTWFDSYYRRGIAFSVSGCDPPMLFLYPWHTFDASTDVFVRVPETSSGGATIDTSKIVQPIEVPSARYDGRRTTVHLSAPMREALREIDPVFRVLSGPDTNEPRSSRLCNGPSAIVGDFDGDLLRDVALLGTSGADQVVITVLSNYGRIVAREVAWRRARLGEGIHKSRGDPQRLAPVSLELVEQGSRNPFCWIPRWLPTPYDAIGIVESGTVRFDYVLSKGRFVLFAPVP